MPRRFIRRENWEFGGAAPGSEETTEPRSRKRRLASTLVFTTIFFAGASLAAVAGDQLRPLVANDSQNSLPTRRPPRRRNRLRRRPRTPRRPQPPRRTSPRPRTQRHLPMRPQHRRMRPQPRPTPRTLRRRTMRCRRNMPQVLRVLRPRLSRLPSRTRTHRSRPERRHVRGRRRSCARCSCRS
jgi:hypothetical protein